MSLFEEIGEEIKKMLPDAVFTEGEKSASIAADLDVGIKGVHVDIDYSDTIVKFNATREYKYPIKEKAVEGFQDEILEKYNDYTIYVTGQILNISRFFTYQDKKEAVQIISATMDVIRETVILFEDRCVDFQEKNPETKQDEEYDPEENIKIVDVDNSFHAVSTTAQDIEAYTEEHKTFAKTAFIELAHELGAEITEDTKIECTDPKTGHITKCLLLEEYQEIKMSVSIPASQDVGAMYESYMASNYADLMSSYDAGNEMFVVRAYSYPDPYTPDSAKDLIKLCYAAIDACIAEYRQTLEKKNSTDFASEVQQILVEQTASIEERERELSEREDMLKTAFEKVQQKEKVLQDRIEELEKEKLKHEAELQSEYDRIQSREKEMEEEIKKYEERNTGDILKIQKLANQVAMLQNRQKALGQDENGAEEEIFRLKTKIQQLTGQKVALEKKLTEKINAKEARIREMSDIIREKETNLKKVETTIDDQVKSILSAETKKNTEYIEELEAKIAEMGHVLTPEDLMEYLQKDPDIKVKKLHSTNARFVAYRDGRLDIRVRFGKTNYIDVSCEATLKDVILRKLNSKAIGLGDDPDIKFFSSNTEKKIVARSYFKRTADVEEVEELIGAICSYFNK